MGAGSDGFKLETKSMLTKKPKGRESFKKLLMVSIQPKDRFRLVYVIMLLQGMGTLLPWNMFITAHGYFLSKFRTNKEIKHSFENYFSIAAMVPNVIMFFLNTLFKHKVPLKVRMVTSVVIMTLLFVLTTALVKVDSKEWTNDFFFITIGTVILINMASAVYQGGLFGLSGMMPPKYTGAVMTGQGIGGTFAALANIVSLLGDEDISNSAFGYFMSAVSVLLLCTVTYIFLYRVRFAKYYLGENTKKSEVVIDAKEGADQCSRIANWQIPQQKNGTYPSTLSLGGELHHSINCMPEYDSKDTKPLGGEAKQMPPFWSIFKKIYRVGLSVMVVFFATLAVYPSITARIKSKNDGDGSPWTTTFFVPVTCFLLFNVGDFLGRLSASFIQIPGKNSVLLPLLCFLRLGFLPLFALCNVHPRHHMPVLFHDDVWYIVFMALFAISNGHLGSLCMMYGPALVDSKHAETAGTMMAFLLILGLGFGAAFSFVMSAIL